MQLFNFYGRINTSDTEIPIEFPGNIVIWYSIIYYRSFGYKYALTIWAWCGNNLIKRLEWNIVKLNNFLKLKYRLANIKYFSISITNICYLILIRKNIHLVLLPFNIFWLSRHWWKNSSDSKFSNYRPEGLWRLVQGGTARWLANATIITGPSPAIIAEPVIISTILSYTSTQYFIMLVLYFFIQVL